MNIMNQSKSTIYIPTVAEFDQDLRTSRELARPFQTKGIANGLMLVIRGGEQGLTGETRQKQYENFSRLTNQEGPLPVIVMVSNLPIEELDFYHSPGQSVKHISKAIDFANELPGRQEYPIVTFHLNSLLNTNEWLSVGHTSEARFDFFRKKLSEDIIPAIKVVASYAKEKEVELKVETTPVPEFGDRAETSLNSLGNPYPLYSQRGIPELREAGLGIVLDLCHAYTLFKACSFADSKPETQFYETYKGIFPKDVEMLKGRDILEEVKALKTADVIHFNDSLDIFDPETDTLHKEGVTLGEGEIKSLPEIIKTAMAQGNKIVFEINETDFVARPNTKKSIAYFLNHAFSN